MYEHQIRLLQHALYLCRVMEIDDWDIALDEKVQLKKAMCSIGSKKYGSLKSVDNGLLSGKVNIFAVGYYFDTDAKDLKTTAEIKCFILNKKEKEKLEM